MTAVEQLRSEFFSYAEHCPRSIEEEKWTITLEDFEYLIKKFKAVEEEQIIKAVQSGWKDGCMYSNGEEWEYQSAEHYYESNYKSE